MGSFPPPQNIFTVLSHLPRLNPQGKRFSPGLSFEPQGCKREHVCVWGVRGGLQQAATQKSMSNVNLVGSETLPWGRIPY